MLSNYLGDKPFWRVTARLALPIAIQNVLTSSFQLVDTLMVSRLGDVTLSAVGLVTSAPASVSSRLPMFWGSD